MPTARGEAKREAAQGNRWPRRSTILAVLGALLVIVSISTIVIRPFERSAGPEAGDPAVSETPTESPATDAPQTPPTSAPPTPTPTPSTALTPKTATVPAPVYAGFPNAGNTGWRRTGVTLKAYTGSANVTTAGTVIDGKDLGCLNIQAKNVTIKRSRIRCDSLFPVRVFDGANVTVEDTEIDGGGSVEATCITSERYVARRVDCHGVGDGMYIIGSNVTIEDSYIHDLVSCGGCHNDGIQVTSGISVVIRHNTIENKFSQTSCIKIGNEQGPVRDVLVDSNLFNGGGYALYAGGQGADVSNMRFVNNRFAKAFFPQSGSYGPVAYYVASVPGNVWSGNVWDDSGAAVKPA